MLVFSKARLVLLSVPKTGTTAIETVLAPHAAIAVLDPPELKHAPVYRYNRFFRPMIEKFIGSEIEVMAMIREPRSWLGSWYRYRQRSFLDGQPQSTAGLSFEEFVQAYLTEPRKVLQTSARRRSSSNPALMVSRSTACFATSNSTMRLPICKTVSGSTSRYRAVMSPPNAELTLSDETDARLRAGCARDFELWDSLG